MSRVNAFTINYNGSSPVLKSRISISSELLSKKTVSCDAIWDTGASVSTINCKIIEQLGLTPVGKLDVHTANGRVLSDTYIVNLHLPNGVVIENNLVTHNDIFGADMLIGMDVISKGDFAVSNFNKKTTFSFRIPSQEVTDYVDKANRIKFIEPSPIPRRKPCPCGSGERYKDCCEKKDKEKRKV